MSPNPCNRRRRGLLALSVAGLLAGCKTISGAVDGAKGMVGLGPKPVAPDWKSLALHAADDANGNSAIRIDLAFVRDTAVLDSLMTMPASKWFASRDDMKRSFPEGLTVLPFELVPGQTKKVQAAEWNEVTAWGVLAFADYATPGEHRARLLLDTPGYLVELGTRDFSAIDLKPGAAR